MKNQMKSPCSKCGQGLSKEWFEAREKRKSDRLKESLRMAKSLGEPVGRPITAPVDRIRGLRRAGMGIYQIAESTGVSPSTVSRHKKDPK